MFLHWVEILKFFKRNYLKIILGSIIGGTIFVILNSSFSQNRNIEESIENKETNTIVDRKITSKPVSFYFYVENQEGESFSNGQIIEQYILAPQKLEEASKITNTNLIEIVEEKDNEIEVNYNDSGISKIIRVSRDEASNLMELSINVGDSRKNITIANYYRNLIENKEIPFFSDKNVFIFTEPTIKDVGNIFTTTLSEDDIVANNNDENIIIDFVIGFSLGGLLTIFVLIIATFFSKKLMYSFSYFIKDKDIVYVVDDLTNNDMIINELIEYPTEFKKVIVSELYLENISKENNSDTLQVDNLLKVKKIGDLDRLIYIIEEGTTNREWYNKQRQIDQYSEAQTYIIQYNKKNKGDNDVFINKENI